jgi:solute carrier family 25 phosphate transporter 3
MSRRNILLTSAIASMAFIPMIESSSAAVASTDPLEELSFGTATWSDSAFSSQQSSSIPLSARIVPPSFATYLARFLLHYDEGASAWWEDQSGSFSLLPSYEAKKREGKSFGSYASSIQKGLYSYVSGEGEKNIQSYAMVQGQYSTLLTSLMDKYGAKDGAIRDIALLFAMLPAVYQPADLLRKIDKAALTATATKESPTEFPPNYQEDFTLLLPTKYQAGYSASTKSFTIMPNINLFEIGINEDSGSPAIATTFGPLSSRPLSRERKLSLDVYALLGISGGAGCALTHTLVIPLDVVKTRLQTNPGQYVGVFDGATKIAKMEGISSLLLGAQATVVGYTWYGVSVYPCYAFFKRYIGENLLSSALSIAHSDEIALVAGAMASVVASLGLTPIEACRIRAVAQPEIYREMGLLGTLNVIASENEILGWRNLYAGLPSLMTRQVIFGSVKFLCFERASDAIFSVWPELRDATYTALGVTLLAGGISGALSSVVSQPADSVLTYVARQSAVGLSILDGAKLMVENEGIESLFRGVGSRSVWAGCIIAGQFLLYDVFRAFFGISGDNLNQVLEVVLPRNM